MQDSDMMRKIAGLLAKAEGTDNENEASAFFAKAQELMLKYAIEEQEARKVLGAQRASETPIKVDWMFATHDAHAKGKSALLHTVAKANKVMFLVYRNVAYSNTWREGNEGKYSQWGVLVGYAADIERTKLMYASLLIQWTRFVHHDFKESGVEKSAEYGFRTGHLVGFASRIQQRLRDLEAQVLDTTGQALMLDKWADVVAWWDEYLGIKKIDICGVFNAKGNAYCQQVKDHDGKHTFTGKVRSSRQRAVDSAGYYAGRTAADRTDLGQTKVANRERITAGR